MKSSYSKIVAAWDRLRIGYASAVGTLTRRSHRRSSASRRPKSSRPKSRATTPSACWIFSANSRGRTAIRAKRFSLSVSTHEVRVLDRGIEIGHHLRGLENIRPVHGALARLHADRTRVHEDEFLDSEVLHGPCDGAHIALVIGFDEDDAQLGHGSLDISVDDIPWHAGRPQDRVRW